MSGCSTICMHWATAAYSSSMVMKKWAWEEACTLWGESENAWFFITTGVFNFGSDGPSSANRLPPVPSLLRIVTNHIIHSRTFLWTCSKLSILYTVIMCICITGSMSSNAIVLLVASSIDPHLLWGRDCFAACAVRHILTDDHLQSFQRSCIIWYI